MLFSVNTNNNSLLAQKALMRTNVGLNKSVAKLSSGSRINDSSDDAAGLSIAENLKKRTLGYREARANNGVALYQNKSAGDVSNEVPSMLKRMRELAIQSSSETLATEEPESTGTNNELGVFLSPSAMRSLQVPIPTVPLTPDVASRSVDLARTGIVENPRVALEAQANQSPERMVYLLD